MLELVGNPKKTCFLMTLLIFKWMLSSVQFSLKVVSVSVEGLQVTRALVASSSLHAYFVIGYYKNLSGVCG